jgi:L-asparagine transporter-like permease
LRGAFFGMMLSWLVSLAAHISFRRGLSLEGISKLPMRSPLGSSGSTAGLVLVTATVLKGWWDSRVNLISGMTLLLGLTLAYFLIRTRRRNC